MLEVKGRIWVNGSRGTYLGLGRLSLLEKIREHGSISGAARSIRMSYKKAWKMVDTMNRQSKKPLVIRAPGGKGGGGTIVTAEGEKAIRYFKKVLAEFDKFCKKHSVRKG